MTLHGGYDVQRNVAVTGFTVTPPAVKCTANEPPPASAAGTGPRVTWSRPGY